ncbi:hypothetical protein G6F31_014500 [Rhizopus arrhizus]|uniref:Uncharacterized protein n=1 Tax=Rhizopus delemar TaxID=936053 RepID=A0A9P6XUZ2_9FUNG|nr:hypothetical protein G6F31_014500 [Rhizopus arrhizus]KAG1533112.1 hypothetical protein G6F50_015979 [Rhizopus delemar]
MAGSGWSVAVSDHTQASQVPGSAGHGLRRFYAPARRRASHLYGQRAHRVPTAPQGAFRKVLYDPPGDPPRVSVGAAPAAAGAVERPSRAVQRLRQPVRSAPVPVPAAGALG